MKGVEIKPDIYSVGVIDWDRKLFDDRETISLGNKTLEFIFIP